MSIYESFCYNGLPFQLVYHDTIGYLAGSCLYLYDLNTKQKDYIFSDKNGFQSFCTHPQKGLIIIAEHSLKPTVYVYQYPSKKLLYKLENVSDLEIIEMDISFDGKKLLVVTGVPHFEITIWDLEKQCRLQGEQSSLPIRGKYYIKSKFSPQKDNLFAVLYENTIVLCEYQPSFEYDEETQQIEKRIRISKQQLNADVSSKYTNFIWDEQNNIYLADNYFTRYLNGTDLVCIMERECEQPIEFFILTQRHLIIIFQNQKFEWVYKYYQSNVDEEERKPFELDKSWNHDGEKIQQLVYNHFYSKIYAGTEEGSLFCIPCEADTNEEEEDDDQDQKEDNVSNKSDSDIVITMEIEVIGQFHQSQIIFIREYSKYNLCLTVSRSGHIFIWDVEERKQLSDEQVISGDISSADMSKDDQLLLLGSERGVVRIMDVSNPSPGGMKLIKHIKFFRNKPITFIQYNKDNKMFAVGSCKSRKVFFVNAQQFNIIGFSDCPGKVLGFNWNFSNKSLCGSNTNTLFVAIQYFIVTLVPPNQENAVGDNLKMEVEVCPQFIRKVDPDLSLIACNHNNGDVYATGADKIIKKYKQPEEVLSKIDGRVKTALTPQEETDGHPLQTNVFHVSQKFNLLVSGGQDGTIFVRNLDKINEIRNSIKAHNLKDKGVSAIEFSKKYNIVYSGGYDGSFFIWNLDNSSPSFGSYDLDVKENNSYEAINDVDDDEIDFYKKVLEDEYIRSQQESKEIKKKQIQVELETIKEKLQGFLQDNENADELEKLKRDDFCIDLKTRDKLLDAGKTSQTEIRDTSLRENYRQQIIYNEVKNRSWKMMEFHLKGISALRTSLLVYNFHIRARNDEELNFLNLVKHYRRLELKEQNIRKEAKEEEILKIEDFVKNPQAYIINAKPGKTPLVLVNYEKLEELERKEKEATKGASKLGGPAGRGRGKKEDDKKKEEEEKKDEVAEVKKEEEPQDGNNMSDHDYLYGALELFTNNRKRNQIILLHNIIFNIKKEFNTEFEKMEKFRNSQIASIDDKNKRMIEILQELHKIEDPVKPNENEFENPNRMLEPDDLEIKCERYLSKEERAELERKRKEEELRQLELLKDDAGIRAIKQMMNGTLEEKKENALEEELVKEEWMDKDQADMNEEERMKFKEYEIKKQKLEEEKDKIRKNLEVELKKSKQEVTELCQKFDEKLIILFKKKLEYDYRIYEQELYIVKLALSIISQEQHVKKTIEFDTAKNKTAKSYGDAQEQRQKREDLKVEQDEKRQFLNQRFDGYIQQNRVSTNIKPDDVKKIWKFAFEDMRKDEKKRKEQEESIMKNEKFVNQLLQLDPFIDLHKKEILKTISQDFDSYVDDINERINNQNLFVEVKEEDEKESQKRALYLVLQGRFKLKKELDFQESDLRDLNISINFFEQELENLNQQMDNLEFDENALKEQQDKSKSNIEVMLRFKQAYVEINQDRPVPTLTDAILVPIEVINAKNKEIKSQGKKKIELLEDIKNIKFEVSFQDYLNKYRDLVIDKCNNETKEVQLLKVKKTMQQALTKKDMKLNDYELKNLQEQIDILKQATDKRINIFQKKEEKIEEQIEFIKRENEQLKQQGAKLDNEVRQRQRISDMMFKKKPNAAQVQDDKTDIEAYDKFRQIATNRKLFDLAKRQTEEIELLREELNKLKARTFANFSNVQR